MAGEFKFIPNPLLDEEWEASPIAKEMLDGIASSAEEKAKSLVNRDTGATADSIHVEDNPEDGHPGRAIVATTPWAGYLETGTSDTPAQPYLRPALDEVLG